MVYTRSASQLPCPRCGNKKTLGTFCKECLQQLHPLVKSIKNSSITYCALCTRVKPHHEWKHYAQEEILVKSLSQNLIFDPEATIDSVEFGDSIVERKPGIKKKTTVLVIVTGKNESAKSSYEEEYDLPFEYEVTLCPLCRKKGSSYYEGILQIRNQTVAVRGAIYKYIAEHKKKGLRLAKEVPVSSGSDYYLSSQRSVHHLARFLRQQFGGEMKISAQHFSANAQSGKVLYRVNALLEIPEYTKGDVIRRDDQYYFVLGISSKVKAENLSTGSQENFAYEKGGVIRLPVKTTTVSSVDPVEILHPVTFQSAVPHNSKYAPAELDAGEEVSVAYDAGYVFLIPNTKEKGEIVRKKKRHSQKRKKKDDDLVRDD